jgi:hypothetical protein
MPDRSEKAKILGLMKKSWSIWFLLFVLAGLIVAWRGSEERKQTNNDFLLVEISGIGFEKFFRVGNSFEIIFFSEVTLSLKSYSSDFKIENKAEKILTQSDTIKGKTFTITRKKESSSPLSLYSPDTPDWFKDNRGKRITFATIENFLVGDTNDEKEDDIFFEFNLLKGDKIEFKENEELNKITFKRLDETRESCPELKFIKEEAKNKIRADRDRQINSGKCTYRFSISRDIPDAPECPVEIKDITIEHGEKNEKFLVGTLTSTQKGVTISWVIKSNEYDINIKTPVKDKVNEKRKLVSLSTAINVGDEVAYTYSAPNCEEKSGNVKCPPINCDYAIVKNFALDENCQTLSGTVKNTSTSAKELLVKLQCKLLPDDTLKDGATVRINTKDLETPIKFDFTPPLEEGQEIEWQLVIVGNTDCSYGPFKVKCPKGPPPDCPYKLTLIGNPENNICDGGFEQGFNIVNKNDVSVDPYSIKVFYRSDRRSNGNCSYNSYSKRHQVKVSPPEKKGKEKIDIWVSFKDTKDSTQECYLKSIEVCWGDWKVGEKITERPPSTKISLYPELYAKLKNLMSSWDTTFHTKIFFEQYPNADSLWLDYFIGYEADVPDSSSCKEWKSPLLKLNFTSERAIELGPKDWVLLASVESKGRPDYSYSYKSRKGLVGRKLLLKEQEDTLDFSLKYDPYWNRSSKGHGQFIYKVYEKGKRTCECE